jgi:hypothetical protein
MVEWASIGRLRETRSPALGFDYMSSIDAIRWMFPHNRAAEEEIDEHFPIQIPAEGRGPIRFLQALCTLIRGIPPEQPRSTFLPVGRRSAEENGRR